MQFFNHAELWGKVVKDPTLSKTKKNKSVCKLILVVEGRIGGKTIRPDYIPIAFWDRKADAANDLIRRGDILHVVGRVTQERWVTSDNERRSRIVVQASKFEVVEGNDSYEEDYGEESDYDSDDENGEIDDDEVGNDEEY
jgi:single-stranded DNA-binding protein